MLEETAEPVPRDAACSFCRKTRAEVRVLIHAPAEYVCDECVQLCSEILEATRSLRAAPELPIARVRQKKWWQRWHRRG
jgi:ATP-dependent Clp protease ATP-binding subunit ClpX